MICLPPGKRADAGVMEAIRVGLKVNKDGLGYCIAITDGPVTKYVGANALDDGGTEVAIKQFQELRDKLPGGPAIIHLRWATAGSRCMENVQPWPLDQAIVAMSGHYFDIAPGEVKSDARIIADDLQGADFSLQEVRDRVEKSIPDHCSMIVLSYGKEYILGESNGYWRDDAWYSSSDFIEAPAVDLSGIEWTDGLDDKHARYLFRELGDSLAHNGVSMDMPTYLEISDLRGDLLAVHPQMGTGCPE
jgi:hypothetical protein